MTSRSLFSYFFRLVISMKKFFFFSLLALLLLFLPACAAKDLYVLNESSFFLVMTNMQYYPEQYIGSTIEYDCFTYELTDIHGNSYICGVRKCSSGYGCTCGNDTIIGFILESEEPLPAPKNQSEDNNDKTWIHVRGMLKSAQKQEITIYAYTPDGNIDYDTTEILSFLTFQTESVSLIEDYSNLHYYVTK